MADYIRDLRPAKWGAMINLRSLSALGGLLPFTGVTSTRNSNGTVGIAGIEVRGLADRSPSERQRSDFMSFQTSRPAAVPVITIPLAFQARRRVRRGSDKRSSRSWPDMDIPLATAGSYFGGYPDWRTPACIQPEPPQSLVFEKVGHASLQAWAKSTRG
jgi:hypothetical protein